MNIKTRLRNKGLWVAVAAWFLLLLQISGVQVVPDQYNAVVTGLLGILGLLGIISDPTTDNTWYRDDDEK